MVAGSKDQRVFGKPNFSKLRGLFRSARSRQVETIVAHYATGRLSDAAEREMTERLLHIGDSFRL